MEKQLVDLYNVAWRCARSGACESKCLNALSRLRVFPVTLGVFTSVPSSIDVFEGVRKLTKHPAKNIRNLSALVVTAWSRKLLKQILEDEKSAVERRNLNGNPLKITIKLRHQVPKPRPHDLDGNTIQERTSSKAKDHVPLVQKPPSKPKSSKSLRKTILKREEENLGIVDYQKPQFNSTTVSKTTNYLRNNIREQVFQALTMVFKEAKDDDIRNQLNSCDLDHTAASLESVLFYKWGVSNSECGAKYRSLLFNIKDPKHPDFRRKILLGEIKPEAVIEMSTQEMASDDRKHKNQGIQARSMWKCTVKRDQEGTTDQFKCRKCGERKTRHHQLQTRSADEPMTTYATCTVCDNRWKFC